nr:MAG TPA: EutP [Caudoviricetes sp.]
MIYLYLIKSVLYISLFNCIGFSDVGKSNIG